jgi:16S rRNA A1518/A1519 N6-dimethyltransferase RsmA/KsgA/DIM1 with predicted DNA glycosylase/AP lyase activity
MRIIEKEPASTYYEIDKFCCDRMRENLDYTDICIWINDKGKIGIGDKYKEYQYISYCPFCGEKIQR